MQNLIKSTERVRTHGEVFTPDGLVGDMLNLVQGECNRIDSRFLEPACGNGNFLAQVIARKLHIVRQKYKNNEYDFCYHSFLVYASTYGIDIMMDNVVECRQRLLDIFTNLYTALFMDWERKYIDCIEFVLSKNIVCGNALDLLDTHKNPIVFSEWNTEIPPYYIVRKQYEMADLMAYAPMQESENHMSLFSDVNERVLLPKCVMAYKPIIFYRVHES